MKDKIRSSLTSVKSQLKQNVIAITSLLVALIGLSANISYMEHKERNSNLREASFQLLIELSELEEITFHLQYDQELSTINARTGWVKVRLITAVSALMPKNIQQNSNQLYQSWSDDWQSLGNPDEKASDNISLKIATVRDNLIILIGSLQ
jgi:hypothetical protein